MHPVWEVMQEKNNFLKLGDWPQNLNERLQILLDYWLSKRDANGLVLKRSIDPVDIPDILPGIMIYERVVSADDDETVRFRYRLAGTFHTTMNGRDVTGMFVDEVHPAGAMLDYDTVFNAVCDTGAVHYKQGPNTTNSRDYQTFERILCPLTADGQTNTHMIGSYHWF